MTDKSKNMKVLVLGKGGREHALCWRLAKSPSVGKVFCIPGSDGISQVAKCAKVSEEKIAGFAKENGISLVVIGPEAPLVSGIADLLRNEGLLVFGPGKKGAMLEGSKVFAKLFMRRHSIPTARFLVASNLDEAYRGIEEIADNVVVKADGLAAGKGVIVCSSKEEAREAVRKLMLEKEMGEAGEKLVIEEKLGGEELSVIAVCDGKDYCVLLPAQDHKRVFDNDIGPNTGGMGAYAPSTKVGTSDIITKVKSEVIDRTIEGLKEDGIDFRGALYCGLMIGRGGDVNVLEFNVRFGDPETQPQMVLFNGDFGSLLYQASSGELGRYTPEWKNGYAITVVLSAEGYPGKPVTGDVIEGLEEMVEDETHVVFHAGTRREGGKWVTDGGRVLGVTACGDSLESARAEVYRMIQKIKWRGMHFRRDIGIKGIGEKS